MNARIRGLPWGQIVLLVLMFVALAVAMPFSLNDNWKHSDIGSSYDVTGSGYRAWYELLQRESLQVGHFNALAFNLKGYGVRTLIVALPEVGDAAFGAQISGVEKFLESGGNLIVLGGVDRRVVARYPFLQTAFKASNNVYATSIDGDLRKADINSIVLTSNIRFTAPTGARILVGDKFGAFAIVKQVHAGRIVAVASPDLFRNDQIADGDNARLAFALVALAGSDGLIAFDEHLHGYGLDRPWWMLLPLADRVALALLIVAFLAWLVYESVRLGPAVTLEPPPDPTTRAYLTSLATLYERAGADSTVICGSVDAVKHLVAAEPGRLATERERADFNRLLGYGSDNYSRNLIPAVRLAVDLRKAFVRYGNRNRARRAAS